MNAYLTERGGGCFLRNRKEVENPHHYCMPPETGQRPTGGGSSPLGARRNASKTERVWVLRPPGPARRRKHAQHTQEKPAAGRQGLLGSPAIENNFSA